MRKSFVFILAFLSSPVWAASLLVSDIDDTIKQSFVLSKIGIVSNAKRTSNDFYGMSELYNHLAQNIPDLEFVYLSNAPSLLMQYPHTLFLQRNGFPSGALLTRKNYSTAEHKIQNIRNLLKVKNYDHVLLIGDNGEKDAAIYHQIAQEFPQIRFQVYIRLVYSVNDKKYIGARVQNNQLGFVSPIDIVNDLADKVIIDYQNALNFSSKLIPSLMAKPLDEDEESVVFPEWQNCTDYKSEIFNFPAQRIAEFERFVQLRCQ